MADEVRKLAEKSGQSANEIDVVTAALNKKTDAVRSAVSASLEHLASSHQSAQNVASVLDAATTSVAAVRNGLDQIVNVTEQQRQSSAYGMAQNIEAIAAMAHDNDVAIQQTVSAAEELQRPADALRDSVSRFKV
ncbi:hypothetical protein [Paludibacterium denitrificans]|uniref:hypothetical protein n=1 Tax=Paludibacterium denitrificans TaxID=2675226 RepID=UPI00406BD913